MNKGFIIGIIAAVVVGTGITAGIGIKVKNDKKADNAGPANKIVVVKDESDANEIDSYTAEGNIMDESFIGELDIISDDGEVVMSDNTGTSGTSSGANNTGKADKQTQALPQDAVPGAAEAPVLPATDNAGNSVNVGNTGNSSNAGNTNNSGSSSGTGSSDNNSSSTGSSSSSTSNQTEDKKPNGEDETNVFDASAGKVYETERIPVR